MELKPIFPFEPVSTNVSPSGSDWVAQIKWDGVRMLHYFNGVETRLFNRKLNERTLQYPELLDTKAFCHADSVILDGEIIAFDNNKPSFHEIMKRDSLKQTQKIQLSIAKVPVTYMIFDVLFYNGAWMTGNTLANRLQLLERIITPRNNIQVTQNFPDGSALFSLMKEYRMEGVVYKDLSSKYAINGKDGRWKKQKIYKDLYAIVGGVTLRNKIVNSLLLGLYTNEQDLLYIGHAGTGKLTNHDWVRITELTSRMVIDRKPFMNEPERSKDAVWVRPELKVKVEFLEFTPNGTMRHPSIQSVVNVSKKECATDQITVT
ncbi:bifunctional non-homologous end joining protein LigD [Paenibacillus tianmuensis]|uniref:DNA ligase (ATP) n=1 Tax=Paenibacillus tianmuensis TaxID=624147 RepID=A0A1G4SLS1_9BACL|nr:DNA ligase [Paenibacillus tianmuensis]SCW69877.1 bifunctional non-homologous end joining protein LigD [Paenibacillus tianmuensis]